MESDYGPIKSGIHVLRCKLIIDKFGGYCAPITRNKIIIDGDSTLINIKKLIKPKKKTWYVYLELFFY